MPSSASSSTVPGLKTSCRLPSPPGVAMEILSLCRREDAQVYEIADVIMSDPALTARLLRFANSPLMGFRRKVASVREAVLLMGLRAVELTALGFSLLSADLQPDCAAFNLRRFWAESFIRASVSRRLAGQFFRLNREEAFATALLSGIGRLALACVMPKEYACVLQMTEAGTPLPEAERQELGVDHAQFGARLLGDWELPDNLVEAVSQQLEADAQDDEAPLARLIYTACHLAPLFQAEPEPDITLATAAHHIVHDKLGCTDESWQEIAEEIAQDYRQVVEVFDFALDRESCVVRLLTDAREEAIRIGLAGQYEQSQLVERHADLLERASTDPLTGVANRAKFLDRLHEVMKGLGRGMGHFGLIMFDLDHFKAINDTYGHQLGDVVLKEVAHAARQALRDIDAIARYGGEEFVILLPETDVAGACAVVDRLSKCVEGLSIDSGQRQVSVTISAGLVHTSDYVELPGSEKLISDADEQMYMSKKAGRNTWHFRGLNATKVRRKMRWWYLSRALTRTPSAQSS